MPDPLRRWQLDGSISLIQEIRLVHAIAESGFDVCVPADQLDKFSILRQRFGLRLAVARPDDPSLTPHVTVDHKTPSTGLGVLVRPLIFPHAIAAYCRALWRPARTHRYSFAGLMTDQRRTLLDAWMAGHHVAPRQPAGTAFGRALRGRLIRWWGDDRRRRIGEVTLWSSERGRRFPTKAWDEEYVQLLADSEHVLCPGGDYHWSYRFFEACLCGALPIVERASPLYEGFRFRLMSDPRGGAPWSAADAEHNYRLCLARIVVPVAELDAELSRLAALPPSAVVSAVPARIAPQRS